MTPRRIIAPVLTLILLLLTLVPAQAQTSFTLGLPDGKTLLRKLSVDLNAFTWTPLAAATSYQLQVFHISGNTRFGTTLNVSVPITNCTATDCAYVLSNEERAMFAAGEYAWTIVAPTSGDSVEASNGPRYFHYNPAPLQLVNNGGFETGRSNPWAGVKLKNDLVVIDDLLSYSGTASWRFKGSTVENSSLSQLRDVTYLNIQPSDVVTLSFAYKASGASLNGLVRVTVLYTDGTGKRELKRLPAVTDYVLVTEVIELTKPVQSIKVSLENRSLTKTSIIYLDEVSLILSGAVTRAAALPFPTH